MLTDEQLAVRAKAGDELASRALHARQRSLIAAIASALYAPGLDRDDLHQEGAIGVYKAIRDWQPERGIPFSAFANLCVKRQLYTAVKAATRAKHSPLNGSVSFDLPYGRHGDATIGEVLSAPASCEPDQVLADRAELEALLDVIQHRLSPLERECLLAFADGEPMLDIQVRHGWPMFSLTAEGRPRPKVVENAIERAKQKIRAALAAADVVPQGEAAA